MIAFAAPFLFAASIPLLYLFGGPEAPLLTPLALALCLLLAELVVPRGAANRPASGAAARWLAYAYVLAQIALIVWATATAARADTSLVAFLSLAFSVGVSTGVFGLLAAHELVHARTELGDAFGLAMLTAMSYRHFAIAHLFGHHRYACTERDPATARLGESVYAFLARTLPGQWREARDFEMRRCAGKRFAFLRNRVHQDIAIMALVLGAVAHTAGPRGLTFFLLQSGIAILLLELFNYIAHYGLARGRTPDGSWERFADHHSWNSSNLAANLMLFNMGRHADHHRRPTQPFDALAYAPDSPELPAGYAGAILMALFPPIWRRVMDKRALAATVPQSTTKAAA